MRFSLASVFVLAIAAFTACQTSAAPETSDAARESAPSENTAVASESATAPAPTVDEHGHENTAPRIELAEAKKLYDEGNALFIDTRSADNYALEHVKGAVNIPMAAFESGAAEVPKGKTIIAYCS